MRPFVISDPRQISALASSVRQDIVDILAVIGPATTPQIARSLGRRPDGLYFHLRLLSRIGLLKEGRRPNDGGRMVATYDVPGRPLRIRYDQSDRGASRAMSRVAASMLRTANRGFARAAAKGDARVSGPRRELWAARTRGWLTQDGLREINETFARLIKLSNNRPGPENACPYEVTLILSPARSA